MLLRLDSTDVELSPYGNALTLANMLLPLLLLRVTSRVTRESPVHTGSFLP